MGKCDFRRDVFPVIELESAISGGTRLALPRPTRRKQTSMRLKLFEVLSQRNFLPGIFLPKLPGKISLGHFTYNITILSLRISTI